MASTFPPTLPPSTTLRTFPPTPPAQVDVSTTTTTALTPNLVPFTTFRQFWSTRSPLTPPQIYAYTATTTSGIFGVGEHFDPLIFFGLVVAGLIFLVLLGTLIYCCCVKCGGYQGYEETALRRTQSFQSIHNEPNVYLQGSCPGVVNSCGSVRSGRVVGERVVGTIQKRIRRDGRASSVFVDSPQVHTLTRKNYLYPADLFGLGNDVTTYNSIRRSIRGSGSVITTLGDGYATGRGLRATGNRYSSGGRSSILIYDDDDDAMLSPAPRVITYY